MDSVVAVEAVAMEVVAAMEADVEVAAMEVNYLVYNT